MTPRDFQWTPRAFHGAKLVVVPAGAFYCPIEEAFYGLMGGPQEPRGVLNDPLGTFLL